jgi:hypothetical protein
VLLLLDLVVSEVAPESLELRVVLLHVVGVVHHEEVLLVGGAGLDCPVERASDQEDAVNDDELVVHVVPL